MFKTPPAMPQAIESTCQNGDTKLDSHNTGHPNSGYRLGNTHSRSLHCLWGDRYEYFQARCKKLADAINTGKVLYKLNHIINSYGKGIHPQNSSWWDENPFEIA